MDLPRRQSSHGPLIDYLVELAATQGTGGAEKAKIATHAIRSVLTSPEGRILMDLLEKSTLDFFLQILVHWPL